MTSTTPRRDDRASAWGGVVESPATVITSIWAMTAVIALWAPGMVTGSQHEHLPIALATTWLCACLASAYAAMTPRRSSRAGWTVSVTVLWLVAAAVTGLLSLHQATR